MANIKGAEVVIKRLERYTKERTRRMETAVDMTLAMVANDAKALVPVRTANLQNSILPGKAERTLGFIRGEVGAHMEYAAFVELGTSRMSPKPYLGPALLKNMSFFRSRVAEAVR